MPLLISLVEFTAAVTTELGAVTVLDGAEHIESNASWPKVVCAPVHERLDNVDEAGFGISDLGAGDVSEQLLGYISVDTEWHMWSESPADLETLRKAVYVAIVRVAKAKHSLTSIETADYPDQIDRTITHGGAYLLAKVTIGFRLVDNAQTPLLTPTSFYHTGTLNDTEGC